jgi:hypothetical protein
MYFNNSGASNQQDPAGAWSNHYIGVWHLEESGTGVDGEYKDSTYRDPGQGGQGIAAYVPKQQVLSGKIGNYQKFDNLVDGKWDFIDVHNSSILDVIGYGLTLEAWVKHNVVVHRPAGQDVYGILNHKGWEYGYSLWMNGEDDQCAYSGSFCVHFNVPGHYYKAQSTTVLTNNVWHHVAGTYNGTWMAIFIDGQGEPNMVPKSDIILAPPPPQNDVWIGYGDQPTDEIWSGEWDGMIDEVRISDVGRSDSWITTEYKNQNNPGVGGFLKSFSTKQTPDTMS